MPPKLIVTECPSKVKRVCRAEGCGAEIRGTDLTLHYKSRVNFKLLKELNIATIANGLVRILANLESNRVCRQSQNFHSKKPVRKILIFFNSLMSRIRF